MQYLVGVLYSCGPCDYILHVSGMSTLRLALVPRPSITANTVESMVKLLCRMTSGGRLEAWYFR